MPRLSRIAFALFLATALATTSALVTGPLPGAVSRPSAAEATVPPNAVARLWSFLASLWSKNGCQVDPSGQCLPGTTPAAKNGCQVDPHGHCIG